MVGGKSQSQKEGQKVKEENSKIEKRFYFGIALGVSWG
jgi:hypothetical protein